MEVNLPCEREPHMRPGYSEVVAATSSGQPCLQCGHNAAMNDLVHCQCGVTLRRCAVCSGLTGRGLTGREYLDKGDPC